MALIAANATRTYFDSNIFIYTLEWRGIYGAVLDRLYDEVDANGHRIVTSEFSLVECLIGPMQVSTPQTEFDYAAMILESALVEPVALSRGVLLTAGRLGREARMKPPDAIHVASALIAGCSVFLTNDVRLRVPSALRKLYLSELAEGPGGA